MVADPFRFGDAIAAKRDVEIVTEPRGQGDMPPFPEVWYRGREVWEIEVVTKVDTEEFRGPSGDIGIAGEVGIDLDGEEDGGDHERAACCGFRGGIGTGNVGGKSICNNHFLKEPPDNELYSF